MEKAGFEKFVTDYTNTAPENFVPAEIALRPELAGMRIFEEPLFGYADAGDPLFAELKKPAVIGDHLLLPSDWLPGARTVISVFLPFTKEVKEANRRDLNWPADEWLHARIEGQKFQAELCVRAVSAFRDAGFSALAPMIDSRFSSKHPSIGDKNEQAYYTSNWSERHAAYICGLGTFGLSRGLITSRGIAGRLVSLISSAPFEPVPRPYNGVYEYCIRCNACVRNCPAEAISPERGKSHPACSAFLNRVMEKCKPRYGCGNCQVKTPCENRIPAK
jgi:epoxyqueuosine reductase QueG